MSRVGAALRALVAPGPAPVAPELGELLHRQAIADCILRYARGVDRLDAELVASAYHPDAVDHHGPLTGSPEAFTAWYWAQAPSRAATQHFVLNQLVDLDGDVAHAETYFVAFVRAAEAGEGTEAQEPPEAALVCGRYVDRLERRAGAWRIARRVVVREGRLTGADRSAALTNLIGRQDRHDVSYRRPLTASGLPG